MTAHVLGIQIPVQMYILFCGSPAPVTQDGLSDIHACSPVDLSGCGMSEKMAVKMFVKRQALFGHVKNVLNRS